jgi:hypothetical protein
MILRRNAILRDEAIPSNLEFFWIDCNILEETLYQTETLSNVIKIPKK